VRHDWAWLWWFCVLDGPPALRVRMQRHRATDDQTNMTGLRQCYEERTAVDSRLAMATKPICVHTNAGFSSGMQVVNLPRSYAELNPLLWTHHDAKYA
jgi:hypothetical protein